jgi:hypothetical protein
MIVVDRSLDTRHRAVGKMRRVFCLSFCDSRRPEGDRFLGACVVDVTDEDVREARTMLALQFPNARNGAEWLSAAIRRAHREHCNPGGDVLGFDISNDPSADRFPRNTLLSRSEFDAINAPAFALVSDAIAASARAWRRKPMLRVLACELAREMERDAVTGEYCCWPTHATMAEWLGCSVRSISNYLNELCADAEPYGLFRRLKGATVYAQGEPRQPWSSAFYLRLDRITQGSASRRDAPAMLAIDAQG